MKFRMEFAYEGREVEVRLQDLERKDWIRIDFDTDEITDATLLHEIAYIIDNCGGSFRSFLNEMAEASESCDRCGRSDVRVERSDNEMRCADCDGFD